jgi:hypothetical protein
MNIGEALLFVLACLAAVPVLWCLTVGGVITAAMISEHFESKAWAKARDEAKAKFDAEQTQPGDANG